jgi:sulfatase maturation enzyme AslB (radical SAM superfamily)|tara:strand:- start:1431 stop:2348 length:918 start_codon:yes stop_codon:yes gene_type:complete
MSKCAAFWKHTNLRNNNKIYPCCRFKTPVQSFDGNIENVLHSDTYKKLRNTDVSKLSDCSKCMYEEANGKHSLRQTFNEEYDTDTVELKYLELGLDNVCNLTCDGCFGDFSSEWSKIENPTMPAAFHVRSTKKFLSVPASVNKILFLGGEPLMTTRHLKVLEKVINKDTTSVTYNTNGTFLLDTATLDQLQHFKEVNFILSIDAYKDLNDKVRSGSKWNDILKFIKQVKQTKFNLTVNSVLHLNNWHGFVDLETFINEINVNWEVNILTYPKHLDIANYKNKQEIIDLIEQTRIPNKEYVIKHLS